MGGSQERVAVTGGAGFIGSHVAEALLAGGCDVVVLDDLSAGSEANVPRDARFERIDVRDADALNRVFDAFAPTTVCHLAAQASVTESVQRPQHDLDVNVRGTLNVCEGARRVSAAVVYASTGGAIYGGDAPVPTTETFPPSPLAPYGASKFAGEVYVRTWGTLYGLPNVSLRLGNVYGPRQSPHGEAGVVAIFADRLSRGEAPILYGFGEPTRDYVHVSDVARAFVLASEVRRAGTFNVGTGVETSVRRLLDVLAETAGTAIEPDLQPLRPGELERSALDSTLIEREFGWRAEIPLERGLAETYPTYVPA